MRNPLCLLLWGALLTGCGAAPVPVKPAANAAAPTVEIPKGPFAADARLVWSADGRAVIVDDEWRLEPDSGRFLPVASRLPPGSTLITSSQGQTAAVTPTKITVVDGPEMEVPNWLEEGEPERVVAAWINRERLYVHQQGPGGDACRLRDLPANAWRPASGGCVEPDGPLVELIRGPGAMLGVRTAKHTRFQFYDPRRSRVALKAAAAPEPARATFGLQGGSVWVVSACKPGSDACAAGPQRLYELDLLDGSVTDRGAAPEGAIPGPGGGMAWIANGSVCLGTSPTPTRCVKP